MRIERVVASVTDPNGCERRQACMQILARHEIWNEEIRQSRLSQRISQEDILCLFLIERLLELKAELSLACGEDRILFVVLPCGRKACRPIRPPEIRIREYERQPAIKWSIQCSERCGLRLTANIV